jgi:hypothetical protein
MDKNTSLNNSEVDRKKEIKKKWQLENKDKIAEYAKNYYRKKVDSDPEYKKILCEKRKERNLKNGSTKSKILGRPRILTSDSYELKL